MGRNIRRNILRELFGPNCRVGFLPSIPFNRWFPTTTSKPWEYEINTQYTFVAFAFFQDNMLFLAFGEYTKFIELQIDLNDEFDFTNGKIKIQKSLAKALVRVK